MKRILVSVFFALLAGLIALGVIIKVDMGRYELIPHYHFFEQDDLRYSFTFDWGNPVAAESDADQNLIRFRPAISLYEEPAACEVELKEIQVFASGGHEVSLSLEDIISRSKTRWNFKEIHLEKGDKEVRIEMTLPCKPQNSIAEFNFRYDEEVRIVNYFKFMSRQ